MWIDNNNQQGKKNTQNKLISLAIDLVAISQSVRSHHKGEPYRANVVEIAIIYVNRQIAIIC